MPDNNPLERILREIRRRTRVVGAFPDGQSSLNLAAARLRHIAGSAWSSKRYLNIELLKDQQMTLKAVPGAAQPKSKVRKSLDTSLQARHDTPRPYGDESKASYRPKSSFLSQGIALMRHQAA
jgi:hypothetical protein